MEMLEKILKEKQNRKQLIKQFQEHVWHHDALQNKILSELAYDLDFYEPDATLRAQDPSYYGDEQLEEEVKSALEKLKKANT
jgi:hypothetical protein